jgi:hypothetical protein
MVERLVDPAAQRDYVDECGLGMTLGTFIDQKGLLRTKDSYIDHRKGGHHNEESVRLLLNSDIHRPHNAKVNHLMDARVGTSYRNIAMIARTHPKDSLVSALDDVSYKTYTQAEGLLQDLEENKLSITERTHISEAEFWITAWQLFSKHVSRTKDGISLRRIPVANESDAAARGILYGSTSVSPEDFRAAEKFSRLIDLLVKRAGLTYARTSQITT